jgi:hypothetical protein
MNAGANAVSRKGLRPLLTLAALLIPTVAIALPTFQPNVDMKGLDYNHFDLPRPSARLCQEACLADDRCQAWTFVRPTHFGPRATCWLKSRVPEGQSSACCVSGTR